MYALSRYSQKWGRIAKCYLQLSWKHITVSRGDREILLERLKLQGGNCNSTLENVKKKAEFSTQTPSCESTQQISFVNILRTQFLNLLSNLVVTLLYILH